jgi:predicted Zn-dependent protease
MTTDPAAFDEIYFDGRSNARRSVSLRLADALQMFENDSFVTAWPYADIRRVDGPDGVLRIRSIAAPAGARCEIRNAQFAAALVARCRLIDGEAQEAHSATWRIVGWSLAAAASLAGIVWYGVPLLATRITPFVPYSIERRIGEAADSQARAMFKGSCTGADGQAAFDKLVAGLTKVAGVPQEVRVAALPSKVVNAFALPGGHVYVLSGLIDAAQSPDELAGVLAHEFGHVAHRDGMRVMIEQGSAAFVIGLFFGDVFGAGAMAAAARASLGAAYTREAETEADDFANATLLRAGRPARPLGELLTRISKGEKKTPLDFLRDHPLSSERLSRIAAASHEASAAPLLNENEWRALKAICAGAG